MIGMRVQVLTCDFHCHFLIPTFTQAYHFGDNFVISRYASKKKMAAQFIALYIINVCFRVIHRLFGLVGRVFANGPEDLGSIPGRNIPKTLKMILDTSLHNTQQYKVRIKGKVMQSWERSSALPYNSL